jgi:hypothetical protein
VINVIHCSLSLLNITWMTLEHLRVPALVTMTPSLFTVPLGSLAVQTNKSLSVMCILLRITKTLAFVSDFLSTNFDDPLRQFTCRWKMNQCYTTSCLYLLLLNG